MTKTTLETGDWHVEAIVKNGVKMYRVLNRCGLGIGDFADWHEATLAAAAPGLLAALKALVVCPDYKDIRTHEITAARAAIASAEEAQS